MDSPQAARLVAAPAAAVRVHARAATATPVPWVVPKWNDPRIPFAVILAVYAVLGLTVLGFNRSLGQMSAIVAAGCALDMLLARVLTRRWLVPLSAFITACSLALLLNYAHGTPLLFVPVFIAIASKYVLTFEGRHVFNPSLFGVAVSLLVTGELITAAPAYQWAGGALGMSAFLVMAALALFVFRIGRGPLIVSFLAFYTLQTALRAWVLRFHMPGDMLFLGTLGSPPFFLFTFYMITDPQTSPRTMRGQVTFAAVLTLVDLWLHTRQSVFTLFYAALICAAGRFAFLHARRAWRLGLAGAWARALTPEYARRAAVVGIFAVICASPLLAGGLARSSQASFRMERLPVEHTGLATGMSDVLERTDPRVAHVAKWLLSVGDAVAVGDYDDDGVLDLFLTNPLKRPEDRGALYRGLGDLRFERVPLPAMAAILDQFPATGLPSAAAFVDVDDDGDQDLSVGFGYGRSRLLLNRKSEIGSASFVDASEACGLDDHTVSLAILFFDFDRDAVLDMLVTNAPAPYLADYPEPTPFSVFRLPPAEYEGDRRMLRFMHDGWHDADNGGRNTLYRGRGDGTFEKLEAAEIGMPETHWTIAAGSGDLDRDGWTDLYLASDFGPDDLYLNRDGRGFERVEGRWFGEVGKDTYKGMNSTFADFDRNGWLDVYVSNNHHALQSEGSLLWMTYPTGDDQRPRFRDEATRRGALNENRWGWGAAAGDLDLDGWPDIVQANGMVDDRLDRRYESRKDYWYVNHKLMQAGPEIHTYADMWGDLRGRTIFPNESRRAYLNLGSAAPGTFVDVARAIGIDDPDNSRGAALADFDDDGDLDLVITNQHGPVSVYRNSRRAPASSGTPHFVGVRLIGNGETTTCSAIGTRVEAVYHEAGHDVRQVREIGLLAGFSAQGDPRLLFGLGDYGGRVTLEIDWYGGERQSIEVEADRYHVVRQPPAATRAERGSASVRDQGVVAAREYK